jgi:phospholipase/carboxylesterase
MQAAADMLRIGASPASARAACVFLHGRGQSPEEMAAGPLAGLDLGRIAAALPAAPDRSWYAARAIDPLSDATRAALAAALGVVEATLAALRVAAPGAPVALAGFSQGACVALEYAFSGRPAPDAVLAFTGCRVGRAGDARPNVLPFGLPVYLSGADADPWIPTDALAEAAGELARGGAALRLDVFPGRPHEIGAAEIHMLAGALDDLAAGRTLGFGAGR